MTFNGKEITEETIKITRNHFIDINQRIIDDVVSGVTKVNDRERYLQQLRDQKVYYAAGYSDHTLTFMQRAYYLQEGESIALLP